MKVAQQNDIEIGFIGLKYKEKDRIIFFPLTINHLSHGLPPNLKKLIADFQKHHCTLFQIPHFTKLEWKNFLDTNSIWGGGGVGVGSF